MGAPHKTWLRWLPAAIWMALIFIGSTDLLAGSHTSRFTEPLLRWLFPGISQAAIDTVRFAIRKCGHMTEYAVLAYLVGAALQPSFKPRRWRWSWRASATVILICLLYALSDEWHQSFFPSRQATLRDVAIDTLGATVALALLWARTRRFQTSKRTGVAADLAVE